VKNRATTSRALVGLAPFPDVELEDMRAFRGHLQDHINLVPGGASASRMAS
jgi:hypothetical protein